MKREDLETELKLEFGARWVYELTDADRQYALSFSDLPAAIKYVKKLLRKK